MDKKGSEFQPTIKTLIWYRNLSSNTVLEKSTIGAE